MKWFGLSGLILGLLLTGCGSSNQIFVSSEDKERMDVLLQLGRFYYDQGEYDKAIEVAEKAKKINPLKEEVGQLLAGVYFAKGGFSFIDVLTKIVDLQSATTNSTNSGSSSEDTSDLLGKFGSLLSLNETDLQNMSSGVSVSENQFLKGLDVYYPANPGNFSDTSAPRGKVQTLRLINQTISALCPFVTDASVKAKSDDNIRYQCDSANSKMRRKGQSHFLFAVAHLIEAIAFHMVLLYEPSSFGASSTGTNSTLTGNLVARATRLNSIEISASIIGDYVEAINQLKVDIDKILTTAAGTMLNQTVLNFNMAALAFKSIPGMPKSVSTNIESQLEKLEKAVEQAGKQKDNVDAQASIFKEQLNKKLVPKLKESIGKFNEQIAANGDLSAEEEEQLDQVCKAFESIITDTTETLPDVCQ